MRAKIVAGIGLAVLVMSLSFTSGCKLHAYGDSSGDSDSSRDNSADDGSSISANEVSIGGDVSADDGSSLVGAAPVGGASAAGDPDADGVIEFANLQCSDFKFPDGQGGNLIRPESDSTGKLAIVFAEDFTPESAEEGQDGHFQAVLVVVAETGAVEELVFSGYEGNTLRQVWRGALPGFDYEPRFEIVVGNGTGKRCLLELDLGDEIN